MTPQDIKTIVSAAKARQAQNLITPESACRLFNGFTEGNPHVTVELFASTLVIFDYRQPEDLEIATIRQLVTALIQALPTVQTALWKPRKSKNKNQRRGELLFGDGSELCRRIQENKVAFTVDLQLNQDASFYLDTQHLRTWLHREMRDKQVFNCFAYTGSLGVAAMAGGAKQVLHLDLNRQFLNVAKASYALNNLPIKRSDFIPGDFFALSSRLRREKKLFDCVIIDPPFFSDTSRGRVDLVTSAKHVADKAKPLIGHDGYLVWVNNALFVSGEEFMQTIDLFCQDGYAEKVMHIDAPEHTVGLCPTGEPSWPKSPTPFNHPTKICILRIKRKDEQKPS